MTYPPYLRKKARQLRREKRLTLDELVERLALPRTTIYYWIRDLPIDRRLQTPSRAAAQRKGNRAMCQKYRRLRDEAYLEGRRTFGQLSNDPTFRDFVNLFLAEGYKRSRNKVSIANSDPAIVKLATRWIRRLGERKISFSIQYHADQDLEALREFWSIELGIAPQSVSLQRKSNTSGLAARTWRSRYGVMTVTCNDTYFRARLQGWMDCLKEQWLHSGQIGA